ncbi:hypothetical protein NP233_g11832 [Leucocoprinus birnbaumii]|uniref:BTB domain-containing protein n=1 Tax=Leucocoprinus birnbaumii TaxID=56174 RepID=A0AAD5YNK9_9AGAR|nr:hypothetical protein NP233_g11832 [Leucocoprinus birnbaumii]
MLFSSADLVLIAQPVVDIKPFIIRRGSKRDYWVKVLAKIQVEGFGWDVKPNWIRQKAKAMNPKEDHKVVKKPEETPDVEVALNAQHTKHIKKPRIFYSLKLAVVLAEKSADASPTGVRDKLSDIPDIPYKRLIMMAPFVDPTTTLSTSFTPPFCSAGRILNSKPATGSDTMTEALSRHHQYYISGGDLHFLVRRTHFRVHSYFFRRESKYWSRRLAGPVSPGDEPRLPGTHESTAFVVEDEDPEDFATFLWVFYNPQYSLYRAPLNKWITILRLASLWECSGIRDFAVSYIDKTPMETAQKIQIYQDYHVPQKHLLPLYIELATREKMLEREEFRLLDADTLYSIVRAREMLRAPSPAGSGRDRDILMSPLRSDYSEEDKWDIVTLAFGISAEQVQALRQTGSAEPLPIWKPSRAWTSCADTIISRLFLSTPRHNFFSTLNDAHILAMIAPTHALHNTRSPAIALTKAEEILTSAHFRLGFVEHSAGSLVRGRMRSGTGGADLHLLLGHKLYRIHSHFFIRESKFWRDKLAGPTSPGDEPLLAGTSSTNAIILDERPSDFDCLLYVFYNTKFGDYSQLTLKQWITIIRYATKWNFREVKELAIRYIVNFEMDVVDRIVLYQENKLPEKYLFPLYMQIASREDMLNVEESKALGFDTLVLIHHARERLRTPGLMNNKLLSPIRTDLKHTDVIDIVASTFNISLADATPFPGRLLINQTPPLLSPLVVEDRVLVKGRRRRALEEEGRKALDDMSGYADCGWDGDEDWDLDDVESNVASLGVGSDWDDAWDVDDSSAASALMSV